MNKPETLELFDQPSEEKVTKIIVPRTPNTSVFVINKEDQTIGNLVYQQLLKEKHVEFVGVRVPHPLMHRIEFKIQSSEQTTPSEILKSSISRTRETIEVLKKKFLEQTGSEWDNA